MKFDELDRNMRVFETTHDFSVLPGIYIVARIDGRNFTRLTKDVHHFEAPYDEQFRDYMVATTQHLMQCGFRIVYGYTQSDEISLLFHRDDTTFDRNVRKLNAVLAGEASAKFSVLLGAVASFDCRISQLPLFDHVVDYFRWRHEDAHRNALNAHCYWMLRKQGHTVTAATTALHKLSVAQKNELLFQHNINFNQIPNWQKRGVGVVWDVQEKPAVNPRTGEAVLARRRYSKVELNLPMKDEYGTFIQTVVAAAHRKG